MDQFSFLSVLISVILGLAVAEILQGFRGLLWSRTRIRIYWPVIGWAVLVLLVCFQHWWSMFGMRTHQDWTVEQFAIMVLETILLYIVAGLVFPDFSGETFIDLKQSFYAQCRWFFAIGVAIIMVSIGKHLLLDGQLPNPTKLIFQAMFGLTLFIGALTRREWYHKTLVVFTNAAFILYIVLLYTRMR